MYYEDKAAVYAAVKAELTNDPTAVGYKVAGVFLPPATLADLLTRSTQIANPNPQPNKPVPLTVAGMLALISPASTTKIQESGYVKFLADAINGQDRAALALWLQLFVNSNTITTEEATALHQAFTATEPDPSWQATIIGPSRLVIVANVGAISAAQITEALAS
jgi:hypothetical protein